jgi:hypothetical protein
MPVVQGAKGNISIEINQALDPVAKEIEAHPELLQHERQFLLQVVNEMKDALSKKDKERFEGLKSSALRIAPFLSILLNNPEFQEFVKNY